MIEKPSPHVSNPEFVRGWNAAMSHAEDILVNLAVHAGATKSCGGEAYFAQRILLSAAETVGKCRRPTKRHYG